MIGLLKLPFTLLALLVGRFSWSAPPWLLALAGLHNRHRAASAVLSAALLAAIAGYFYYESLPKPLTVRASASQIGITPNHENAQPDALEIRFDYDFSTLRENQQRPSGSPSVARIDLVGKSLDQGLSLSPAKAGAWSWVDDRRLRFVPETDWPAGEDYRVELEPSLFAQGTRLANDQVAFSTPAFEADIASIEFYQDPTEAGVRRVVSTIRFSHPVDPESLRARLSLGMRPSDKTIDSDPEPYAFELSYDDNRREAYLVSAPVALPERPNYMQLVIASGVATPLGGSDSADPVEAQTLVPDRFSFLKVASLDARIVRNQRDQPEQVILLEFSDEIDQDEFLDKLSLHLLPTRGEPQGRARWQGPRQVTPGVLAASRPVEFRLLPNARDHSTLYSLVVDVPPQGYLYVRIDEGLRSINGFVKRDFYDGLVAAPAYPQEAKIAGEGSILSYSGEQQLSVLTRGLAAVEFVIGKLVKGQVNHLVSQTDGDISNPRFHNWSFNEQNISEIDSLVLNLGSEHPAKANYFSIDLNQYLPRNEARFGLFFVEIRGWDPKLRRAIPNVVDKRLILVTDLGVIVKNNADRSHDVFVQSIADGRPVAHASVELLGRNGLPILVDYTDARGHVSLPSTQGFQREQQPTVYVVRSANDLSFIPYDRYTRQINLSRFDIGGVRPPPNQADALNAYLFSDRGIYRPGETVNLGMIVKHYDLSNVEGIPLELVITGPRNRQALVKRLSLPQQGFFDYQFATDASTLTGSYQANLHLVRDNDHRGRQIGRLRFDVEEFQPDTMKIRSELLNVVEQGWNSAESLQSKAVLTNLFGTPAQDRKVSARLIIEPHNFRFEAYEDYRFTDPYLSRDDEPLRLDRQLPEQRSDGDGVARFDIDLAAFREGTYRLDLVTEGFDQGGGRSVVARNRALISPLQTLVGYKADGDLDYINAGRDRRVELIAIDNQLQAVAAPGLSLELIQVQQVSTLIKQPNNTYKYQTVSKETLLSSEALDIGADGFEYAIDSANPGDFAVEVVNADGLRLARFEYTVVGHANLAGRIDGRAELQLKLDKDDYVAGEEIAMNIRAPYAGAGLITIESDRVHHFKWFRSDTQSSVQTISIPHHLEGTGYVNVAFVRDAGSAEIFSSPLSYAVQPFSIDRSQRRIDVELETDDVVRPGKPMQIGYRTSQPARIAVFAVDEGILQVAGYATPQPLAHFLAKRSLQVSTLQILDLVLPEFDLVKALSAAGGGATMAMAEEMLAQNLNPFVRKTDSPAVFWSGIVDADSDLRTVTFDVPDTFAGQLRVMAVAVGDEAVGAGSRPTLVRGPFVISPSLLTQAAPGDEFEVAVGIANILEGSGEKAPVDLSLDVSEHLEILGNASTRLEIDEGGEQRFRFRVRALDRLGAAEIRFHLRHGDEEATRTASLSLRPALRYRTALDSGFADDAQIELEPGRSLMSELSRQSLTASASPLALVDGLTAYLEHFPHGCTEQVVSKVFPLVGLMQHPAYAAQLPDVAAHMTRLIDKLRERQLSNGGFAFWPGHSNAADYPSVYALHFLLEASERGSPVPPDMLQRGRAFLQEIAARPAASLTRARVRANAIYLLTRMGLVTTNYLVDLEQGLEKAHAGRWRSDLAAVYMAATYRLIQKDDEAGRLIGGFVMNRDEHPDDDGFHSLLAIDAQYVYLLSKHFAERARALDGERIVELTRHVFEGRYNTISSAYAILALGAYSRLALADDFNESIRFSALDSEGRESVLQALAQPFPSAHYPVGTTRVRAQGNEPLFYLNLQAGYDDSLPVAPRAEGIEILREFVDDDGEVVTRFEQGRELTVRLKVRVLDGRDLRNVAIVDLLPGGFEVLRRSVQRDARGWRADYVDIREDRVVFYGSFDSELRELRYRVKLTAAGDFVVPPSYAESMYDRSIRAHSAPSRFEVVARQ